eukprot:TRINITY_DN2073_c0_g1_i1.p1 TRINITY_DN2073_c0_g1~~TRINITY_DN2073_c0_g1_i1.p1  ORF type:complete len:1041 (-),score=266.92 TRINITY_DN2073_c0_g1_i1:832-3954(-)
MADGATPTRPPPLPPRSPQRPTGEEGEDVKEAEEERRWEDGVVVEDGAVKCGTPEALAQLLTAETSAVDCKDFMMHYLLTCSSHTQPLQLLQFLLETFNTADQKGQCAKVIRLRVFLVLKTWVDLSWNSATDLELIQRTRTFAENAKATLSAPSEQLLKRIDKKLGARAASKSKTASTSGPLPILPLFVGLGVPLSPESCTFDSIHVKELAQQMTFFDHSLFAAVRPWEFVGLQWTKSDKSLAPNVHMVTQHFNNVSGWVMLRVCSVENLQRRIRTLEKFIELCEYLLKLNNFYGILQIMSGLSRTPVFRLKQTWAGIAPHHQQLYQSLDQLTSSAKNYSVMRQRIHTILPPCVPYLGVYLTDLTFIEEGNFTLVDASSVANRSVTASRYVNFDKCRQLARVILEVKQYQEAVYNITAHPALQEWLRQIGTTEDTAQDTCFALSTANEPKSEEKLEEKLVSTNKDLIKIEESAAGDASGNDSSSDETVQLLVLYPGERNTILTTVPCKMAVSAAVKKMREGWFNVQSLRAKSDFAATYWHWLATTASPSPAECPLVLVGVANSMRQQCTASAPFCFLVEPASTVGNLVTSYPTFAKRGMDFFALMVRPVLINVVYIAEATTEAAKVTIDAVVPLMTMIPIFEAAFNITTGGFTFAYFENDKLVKWLNSNFSLTEHNLPAEGYIALISLDIFFTKETLGKLRIKCGIETAKQGPVTLTKVLSPQNFCTTGDRWILVLEHLLFIFQDLQRVQVTRCLPLDYFSVTLYETPTGLTVMLRPMVTLKGKYHSYPHPVLLSGAQEPLTRFWFSTLSQLSCVHGKTRVVGASLKSIAARPCCTSLVPSQLQQLITALYSKSLFDNKLLVEKGKPTAVDRLTFQLDLGLPLGDAQPYVITETIMRLLFSLPEPLVTQPVYEKYMLYLASSTVDPDTPTLKSIFEHLPPESQAMLAYLCHFLLEWSDASAVPLQDVAVVFGPLFLRVPPAEFEKQQPLISLVVLLLRHANVVFRHDRELFAHVKATCIAQAPLMSVPIVNCFNKLERKV